MDEGSVKSGVLNKPEEKPSRQIDKLWFVELLSEWKEKCVYLGV